MATFADLVASRKEWIETVLRTWCAQAALKDLQLAEAEWQDIAGRADPAATLWTWAWQRFPDLVHEGLSGVNETHEVQVALNDGTTIVGFPDARQSQRGRLVLLSVSETGPRRYEESRPFAIDEIVAVRRVEERG